MYHETPKLIRNINMYINTIMSCYSKIYKENMRRNLSARTSHSWNEVPQTYIVLYKSVKSLHTVTYLQLGVHSFLISSLCSGIVDTGVAWPADMIDFKISVTHIVEYFINTALWDVT